METTEKLYQLIKVLKSSSLDVKAEAYLAIAGVDGINQDQFIALNSGPFKRTFQKDVQDVSIEEDGAHQEFIAIKLNREGIYDLLPEGIFHHSNETKKRDVGSHGMALEVRRNKMIEGECRKFFAPLENALFVQKLNLESEEYSMIQGLDFGEMDFDLMGFYGLPLDLPKAFIPGFLRIMPYKQLVSSDFQVAEKVLSLMISHPVEFKLIHKTENQCVFSDQDQNHENFGLLGTGSVLGDYFPSYDPKIKTFIGPIHEHELPEYLEGGQKKNVLDRFYRIFLPLDMDIVTEISVREDSLNMDLKNMAGPYLGYSSALESTEILDLVSEIV
ncbi:Uncharacterized protein conserved in bacteria [Aquiflexum balticum DSM 16537]|uniref:Uncharacterized protein conserved in bacteria n=1 Tax=Aquiflexum balticum DSM 16537 TaxID=758820 RepID=A0A1W2H5E4_9BACT|nr:type VI secretion system baseplate subunit TssG [Aquiflexum balticum]SMD44133.1 Uncharacterized protein conserved in bacteria [Aquiflexum balticum DSM 16537]